MRPKNHAAMIRGQVEWALEQISFTGPIRPTFKGIRLGLHADIGEHQYVEYEVESIIRRASENLTYAHRVDHSPPVKSWAIEELEFKLNHLEELGRSQTEAIHRIEKWIELGMPEDEPYEQPGYWSNLEDLWV